MAEWHVSGSESEGEGVGASGIKVGSLSIPPSRLAELLHTIEKKKILDLECLAGTSPSARERRKKHKKQRRKHELSGSATSAKTQEEVSETASELRSTTSTDTREGTREGKWNNVSHFDYFHEDSTGADLTVHKKQRKLPPANKQKRLASLDQIVADVKQQKERHQESTTPEITLPYQHHYLHSATNSLSQHGATNTVDDGFSVGTSTSSVAGPPVFNFDDDSDLDSPTGGCNMKMSVLSQINRVEKLLDDEGLT